MCDCAMIYLLRTSVTYIWSFIKPFTAFFLEIPTGLIACWTGSTFNTTKKYVLTAFLIGITKELFIMPETFAPIVTIVKRPMSVERYFFVVLNVLPVQHAIRKAVSTYFFGYGSWVFAKECCNVFKRGSFCQFIFDINSVF